jgi:predicted nucleic acid-binding protein
VGALNLPAAGTVYADAQILIYSVEQHPTYAPLLLPLWQAVQNGALHAISSELSLLETLVRPIKNGDAALIQSYEGFFLQPGLGLQAITPAVLRDAAALRAHHKLRTPDAIHAATAALASCALVVSNDPALRKDPRLAVQLLDDLLGP